MTRQIDTNINKFKKILRQLLMKHGRKYTSDWCCHMVRVVYMTCTP